MSKSASNPNLPAPRALMKHLKFPLVTPLILLLFISLNRLPAAPPAGYYDNAIGLSGSALKDTLHTIIKGHTVISYSNCDIALGVTDEDPNNSQNIMLLYKGGSVPKSGYGSSWNIEHTWPRSRGTDASPKVSDLHHLFPENPSLNSSRGNSIYNYVPNPTNTDSGNKWTGTQFEVRDAKKGDVARAILYMDVRYESSGPETDLMLSNSLNPPDNTMSVLGTLIQWHNVDAPDNLERLRNDRIGQQYQHNRNPFVDNPDYVYLIYGPVSDDDVLSISSVNRAGAMVTQGASNYPVLTLNLSANPKEWDLNSMTVSNIGVLPDSAITAVRLYRDNDKSGTVTTGDNLLATKAFTSNTATLTCSAPSRAQTTATSFLITASLSASATAGQTLQLRVNGNSLINSTTGGADPNPTFANIDSSIATVARTAVKDWDEY